MTKRIFVTVSFTFTKRQRFLPENRRIVFKKNKNRTVNVGQTGVVLLVSASFFFYFYFLNHDLRLSSTRMYPGDTRCCIHQSHHHMLALRVTMEQNLRNCGWKEDNRRNVRTREKIMRTTGFFFFSFHRCRETSGSLEERECESLTSIKVRKCQIHHLVLQ